MRELIDILDENGMPTHKTKLRNDVHRDGDWHASIHLWIVKGREALFQKRSSTKDSFPECYDATVGGHVEAGESRMDAALRECKEETGIELLPERVIHIGMRRLIIENPLTGFISREFNDIYISKVDEYISVLPNEEIESMQWKNLDDIRTNLSIDKPGDVCVQVEELDMVMNAL